MTPEPRLDTGSWRSGRRSPKKKRNQGSSACGLGVCLWPFLLVKMLTTAGIACWAASLYEPGAEEPATLGTTSFSATMGEPDCTATRPRCSHSGLSVATTNHTASTTVTA